MPFNGSGSDWEESSASTYRNQLVAQFHRVLYQNNVGLDFIFAEDPRLEDYKLVIIPSLYIASDDLLEKIDAYVKSGGHVVLQFKSGFCDENSMVRPVMAPGPLRKACGFYYQEFSNISELSLKDNPFGVEENVARDWMEYLVPESAKPLAYYDHPYFSEFPAITLNHYGKGTLLYQGSLFPDQIQAELLKEALLRAGVESLDFQFKWPVIAKSGINDFGNKVHFYYNYSSAGKEIEYPHSHGKELVSDQPVKTGENMVIKPWDVLIIEEN